MVVSLRPFKKLLLFLFWSFWLQFRLLTILSPNKTAECSGYCNLSIDSDSFVEAIKVSEAEVQRIKHLHLVFPIDFLLRHQAFDVLLNHDCILILHYYFQGSFVFELFPSSNNALASNNFLDHFEESDLLRKELSPSPLNDLGLSVSLICVKQLMVLLLQLFLAQCVHIRPLNDVHMIHIFELWKHFFYCLMLGL